MVKDLAYYMSLPYRTEVIPAADEGGFALHCPELPGCATCADGLEEGFKLLEDAKRSWFTACLSDGIPIPEPPGWTSSADSSSCVCPAPSISALPSSLRRKWSHEPTAHLLSKDI